MDSDKKTNANEGEESIKDLKAYSIEQFPKNKEIVGLSKESEHIRKNQKKFTYKNKFTCVKCNIEMPIEEFYITDKNTGRRKKSCRDCQMKSANVLEIGKLRFSKKILEKGFRRCSICKETKQINEYAKNKSTLGGYSNSCKGCNHELSQKFIKSQKQKLGLFYIKQYGKRNYGLDEFDEDSITELRNEIIENRKPKYFLDEKEFVTASALARYIQVQYGIPISMTQKRMSAGKTEEQCKLTEGEMRSIAYTKGKIEVKDMVTGVVFEFKNTSDENLLKMFSKSTITRCIKTGEKTKITKLSKYKNPCTITRI